jgi:hypothetical protein
MSKLQTNDPNDKLIDIHQEKSFLTGVFISKENQLYIHAFWSYKKGDFKKMMNQAVKEFSTNKVIFTNILDPEFVFKRLKGFKPFNHYCEIAEEYILCGKGEWNV